MSPAYKIVIYNHKISLSYILTRMCNRYSQAYIRQVWLPLIFKLCQLVYISFLYFLSNHVPWSKIYQTWVRKYVYFPLKCRKKTCVELCYMERGKDKYMHMICLYYIAKYLSCILLFIRAVQKEYLTYFHRSKLDLKNFTEHDLSLFLVVIKLKIKFF